MLPSESLAPLSLLDADTYSPPPLDATSVTRIPSLVASAWEAQTTQWEPYNESTSTLVAQAWEEAEPEIKNEQMEATESEPETLDSEPTIAPAVAMSLLPNPADTDAGNDSRAMGLRLFEDERMFTGEIQDGVLGFDGGGFGQFASIHDSFMLKH